MDSGLDFWGRGVVLGLAIAAPVGPIGLLCIQRTLNGGQWLGLISGLGAATADAIYGCVAGFGLTLIAAFLVNQRFWLSGLGGLFLLYLGVRTFLAQPADKAAALHQTGLLSAYGSTLFLTLTNPMTILSFVAIFAGLGLVSNGGDYWAAALLVLGVFCGSAAWWLLLSGGVSLLRGKINQGALQWINRIAGVVIVGSGLLTLSQLWQ
jgi:threonine/homoserine/homoserine lactone efflux protein